MIKEQESVATHLAEVLESVSEFFKLFVGFF